MLEDGARRPPSYYFYAIHLYTFIYFTPYTYIFYAIYLYFIRHILINNNANFSRMGSLCPVLQHPTITKNLGNIVL